jgi:hypothetical protein
LLPTIRVRRVRRCQQIRSQIARAASPLRRRYKPRARIQARWLCCRTNSLPIGPYSPLHPNILGLARNPSILAITNNLGLNLGPQSLQRHIILTLSFHERARIFVRGSIGIGTAEGDPRADRAIGRESDSRAVEPQTTHAVKGEQDGRHRRWCQWNDGWGWQVRSGARVGGRSSRGRSECREGAAHQDDSGGRLGPMTGLPNAMQVVNWCCPSLEGRRVNQMSWEFSGPTHLLRVEAAVLCARGSVERLGLHSGIFRRSLQCQTEWILEDLSQRSHGIHFGRAQTQGLVREGEC